MKVSALLLLIATAAPAQLTTADPAVQSACFKTTTTPLPADLSGPTPATYPTCDSYTLYEKKDYPSARACAIKERLALIARLPDSPAWNEKFIGGGPSTDDGGDPAGGLIVLTQIYANGEGVSRNLPLAARFFCEAIDTNEVLHDASFSGPTAAKNILSTLDRMQAMTPASPHLNFCETTGDKFPDNTHSHPPPDTPSTRNCEYRSDQEHDAQYPAIHMGGIQDSIDTAEQDEADAEDALKPALAALTPVQRSAYTRLDKAFQNFVANDATGNAIFFQPYSDTGVKAPRGGIYENEDRAAFYTQVLAVLTAPPPAPTSAAFAKSDAALNLIYRNLIAAAKLVSSEPEHFGLTDWLLKEQRAWLAYRDAFAVFGKTLKPNLHATAWELPITVSRTSDLKQVYDVTGVYWVAQAQNDQSWQAAAMRSQNAETEAARSQVSQYFDHQTPAQSAAWHQVQSALTAFASAHNAAVPNASPTFGERQLKFLYGELYAFQYNDQHGFSPADPAKADAGLVANDQRLNAAYQTDLASPCLFQPLPRDPPTLHRTPEGLRAEQRAWLKLRDAWAAFLATLFPTQPHAALVNMVTGARAFELQMLNEICTRNGQPPKER